MWFLQRQADFGYRKIIERGFKMADVFDRVKAIIVDRLEVEESKITREASFMQDLGADSLDTYDLVFAIEEEFDVQVPDDKANEIETVGDVVGFLEEAIK